MSVRAACIDIGSNTTRLLVAERDPARPGALREIAAHRVFVRLSAHERRHGLSPHKLGDIAEAVAEQALTAHTHEIAALRVVATAALRDSPGRDAAIAALSDAAGCPVDVLTAEEEARLTFAGATAGLGTDGATVAVVDVGGGSTELVAGPVGGPVTWWASLPIGSGALADAHLQGDPPTPEQLAAARADAEAALSTTHCPGAQAAWAVGGSATSLRRLVGARLSAEALDRALAALCRRPAADAALDLGLHVERVRLLPAGLVLLAASARVLGCPLEIGFGGLREGVILELLARAADA